MLKQTIDIPASLTDQTLALEITTADPIVNAVLSGGTPIPEPEPNKPPVITSTSIGKVILPVDEIQLKGHATDEDGNIVKVEWKQKSGPVSNLIDTDKEIARLIKPFAGNYIFTFTATDNEGGVSSLDVPLVVEAEVIPPVKKTFPITAVQRTDDYSRPGAGMERREYVEMVSTVPAMDEYKRFAMFDIDRGVTAPVYDWTMFDRDFGNAIKAGRKFNFGVMPLFRGVTYKNVGGAGLSYAEHLHNAMQKESVKDWIFNGAWVQNFNSPAWLKGWEVFCQAIADRMVAKGYSKHVGYIDIRGYGEFGEWHSDDWTGREPAGTKATSATLKALIDIYTKVFADYQLVLISDTFNTKANSFMPADVIDYAIAAKTKVAPCGIRCDHWGDPGLDVAMATNPNANAAKFFKERWQFAPVVGEPNSQAGDYSDLSREVRLYHMTSMGNSNFGNSQTAAASVKAAAKVMGHKIGITGGSVDFKERLYISVDWSNVGVCPTYENWEVNYSIGSWSGKSTFNPRLFLPGVKSIIDDFPLPALAAGSYDLKVSVTDPTKVRKDLPLNTVISCKITI